jgi:hypothetical protein
LMAVTCRGSQLNQPTISYAYAREVVILRWGMGSPLTNFDGVADVPSRFGICLQSQADHECCMSRVGRGHLSPDVSHLPGAAQSGLGP